MSMRPRLTVAHSATPSPRLSLVEEVRELYALAKNRRVASLALFRNSTKHPALRRTNVSPRGRERDAA
jgi:hypothetical protein